MSPGSPPGMAADKCVTNEDEFSKRKKEHLVEVLNEPVPSIKGIRDRKFTQEEIRAAIKNMKSGKAAGTDSITVKC